MSGNASSALLYGASRAAFGSALVGTAASLALRPSTAHCASYYRQPYDEDVWQAQHSSHGEKLGLPAVAAAAAAGEVKALKARRPVGWPALGRISGPRNVLLTLVRNEALTCVFVIHGYFDALSAEEDRADLEDREPEHVPFPEAELRVAARRGAFNACVDWSIQLVRSLLDWAASHQLGANLAGKLVKDLKASVQRKGRLVFYYRGVRVVKTSLLSEATLFLADLLVSCSLEVYGAARGAKGPAAPRARRVALRCGLHAARCSAALVGVSLANGVGSTLPAKRGLAMFLLSQLASLAINSVMYPLIERLSGGGGPAGPAPAVPPPLPPPEGDAAEAAPGPAMAEPLLMVNAQMGQGAAAAVAEAAVQAGAAVVAGAAVQAAGGEQGEQQRRPAAAPGGEQQLREMGVQADEPPEPMPQQRRRAVVGMGGQRLPERPARAQRAGPGGVAPPPQAPHTPQFREPRAPSPAPDSEDAELAAAARASAAAAAGAGRPEEAAAADAAAEALGPSAAAPAAAAAEQAGPGPSSAAAQQEAAASAVPAVPGAPAAAGPAAGAAARSSVEIDRVAILSDS